MKLIVDGTFDIVDNFLRSFDVIRPAIYGVLLIVIILFLSNEFERVLGPVRDLLGQRKQMLSPNS